MGRSPHTLDNGTSRRKRREKKRKLKIFKEYSRDLDFRVSSKPSSLNFLL